MSDKDSRHTVYTKKEIFFPVTHCDDWQALGNFPTGLINGQGDDAWITVAVPRNFKSIVDIGLVVIPAEPREPADPMVIQIQTDYGALGELYNINSENSPAKPFATETSTLLEIDFKDVVDTRAVKAGDYIGVQATYVENTNVYVLGVRLRYKARSKD